MATRQVIQVPIESELLRALDELSRARRLSRSAVIREACQRYVRQVEVEALDLAYEDGYRRVPEGSTIGEAQVWLAPEVLREESW